MLSRSLIIPDTNTLRHVINDVSCLNDFRFWGSFIRLISWIKEQGLKDSISIWIPRIVIDELLVQRKEDFNKLHETLTKYTPHFDWITSGDLWLLWIAEYEAFIKDKIETYITTITSWSLDWITIVILESWNKIWLYELLYNQVLNKIPPLNKSSSYKDAYIIALANEYAQKPEYNICFMFSENKNDFNSVKFHEKIEYIASYEILIAKLEDVYKSYLENREYHEWWNTSYYEEILKWELDIISSIEDIEGNSIDIKSYKIQEKLIEISIYIYQDDWDTDFSEMTDDYMKLWNKILFTWSDDIVHERILFLVIDQNKNIIKSYLQ